MARHLVFDHEDGTASAVPVNDLSEVNVKTWSPGQFGDGGTMPKIVDDQTFSLKGVVRVSCQDGAPDGAAIVGSEATLEPLTDEEAAALDAQFETAPKPWEDPDA